MNVKLMQTAGNLCPGDKIVAENQTYLHAAAYQGSKEIDVRWEAEHVTVNKLPPALLLQNFIVVDFHVPGDIVLECTHKDDGQEYCQEQNQHE